MHGSRTNTTSWTEGAFHSTPVSQKAASEKSQPTPSIHTELLKELEEMIDLVASGHLEAVGAVSDLKTLLGEINSLSPPPKDKVALLKAIQRAIAAFENNETQKGLSSMKEAYQTLFGESPSTR
jgi:hypothetical protein